MMLGAGVQSTGFGPVVPDKNETSKDPMALPG